MKKCDTRRISFEGGGGGEGMLKMEKQGSRGRAVFSDGVFRVELVG